MMLSLKHDSSQVPIELISQSDIVILGPIVGGGKRVEGTSFFSRSLLIYHQQPCVLFFQGFLLNRDQFIILAPFLGREVERFGLQQSRVAWHFGREGERSRLSLVR